MDCTCFLKLCDTYRNRYCIELIDNINKTLKDDFGGEVMFTY